jgi:lipoprotein NlpI
MSDKLKTNDCVEIYESRVRLGFLLAGGILLTVGALLMTGACIGLLLGFLGPPPTTVRQFVSPILALLIGIVGIIMFGLATIQAAGRLFSSHDPVLFLTRDGFKDARISSELIPWSTIQSVKDYRGKGLVIDVDPQFVRKLRLGFAARFTRLANRPFGYQGLWVVTFPLENTSTRALLDIIRDRIKRDGLTEAASGGVKRVSLARGFGLLLLGSLAVLFVTLSKRDSNDCEVTSDPSTMISACSHIIDSNGGTMHKRAVAFTNRAAAYLNTGENDRAIADASDAIRLDPKIATAYNNRAAAYKNKGDNDRAIADANEAIQLDPKYAVAYRNRAAAYVQKGDNERAIADYSEAIRFNPKMAVTYVNRAAAYLNTGDNDRAVADANEAIRLDPKIAVAYSNRAAAYLNMGDNDRAIADANEAIRLDPKNSKSYLIRGLLDLYAGLVDKAVADLKQASALAPNDAYAALWLDIVGERNNLPSRLSQTSSQLDMTAWPGPVVRLFMGQMRSDALLTAADDPNATTKKSQVCEANFYTGELSLMKGAKDEAARLFRLAASGCPRGFTEWNAANAELKALGATP